MHWQPSGQVFRAAFVYTSKLPSGGSSHLLLLELFSILLKNELIDAVCRSIIHIIVVYDKGVNAMAGFRWSSMSRVRRRYFLRLAGRIVVLLICAFLCLSSPEQFDILSGWNFFQKFSLLHILWVIWMIDMLVQLLPISRQVPLGSQKLFKTRFEPIREKFSREALKQYIITTTRAAFWVLLIWTALIACIGVLYAMGILNRTAVFMISVVFYVCDLICVLIWCPFRLIMKNRCCTTCRIFNWDHLMMFTPMLFVDSFYTWSLLGVAIAVWVLWEACVLLFPERFWEHTNVALQCSQCTDKLCTQYCQKLR